MFQYVVLSVSSDVILFHRRRKKAGQENGKIKGENMEKVPEPKGGREEKSTNGSPEARKGGTKPTKKL